MKGYTEKKEENKSFELQMWNKETGGGEEEERKRKGEGEGEEEGKWKNEEEWIWWWRDEQSNFSPSRRTFSYSVFSLIAFSPS